MSKDTIGTAQEAADLLDLSLSQFNEQRLAATYEYDPATQELAPLPSKEELSEGTSLRDYMRGRHLVAPTLAGQRRPGGSWEFNLTRLRELREGGWPGASFSAPAERDP